MNAKAIVPVLPSSNIEKDVLWYKKFVDFECNYSDKMYAVLIGMNVEIHLQWHADTIDDPLLGGSVFRIRVDDINPVFEKFVSFGTVKREKLLLNTPWNTHEFDFYDLNRNAIFIMQTL